MVFCNVILFQVIIQTGSRKSLSAVFAFHLFKPSDSVFTEAEGLIPFLPLTSFPLPHPSVFTS